VLFAVGGRSNNNVMRVRRLWNVRSVALKKSERRSVASCDSLSDFCGDHCQWRWGGNTDSKANGDRLESLTGSSKRGRRPVRIVSGIIYSPQT
jgi:hypothetical protein